jgi:effector-binding domain-containing protein
MSYQCELLNRPSQPVLAIRTRAAVQDLPQTMGQALGAIAQYLGQRGEQPAGPPYAAYYNMDMQNLDVEIGFPVGLALPGQGNIQPGQIPAGPAVACLHVGPYDQVHKAYDALMQWLRANGREATGVAYEVYLNDPTDTPPAALQTQVVMPLR